MYTQEIERQKRAMQTNKRRQHLYNTCASTRKYNNKKKKNVGKKKIFVCRLERAIVWCVCVYQIAGFVG